MGNDDQGRFGGIFLQFFVIKRPEKQKTAFSAVLILNGRLKGLEPSNAGATIQSLRTGVNALVARGCEAFRNNERVRNYSKKRYNSSQQSSQ